MYRKKFPKTGIEFTFVGPESLTSFGDKYTSIRKKLANTRGMEWAARNIHSCGGAIEIPTDPLMSMTKAVDSFKKLNNILVNQHGLSGFTREYGGGGCHMHINLSSFSENDIRIIVKNIYTYMTDNPWIAWGFLDPGDNVSSKSLLSGKNLYDKSYHSECSSLAFSKGSHDNRASAFKESLFDKMIRTNKRTLPKYLNKYEIAYYYPIYDLDKSYAVRYSDSTENKQERFTTTSKTIEFRFFDMPSSDKELVFNISVAHAIFNKCCNNFKYRNFYEDKGELLAFPFSNMTMTKMKNMSAAQAIRKFNHSIYELGLYNNDFKKLHQTNIKKRFKLSKQFKRGNYLS